MKTKTVARNLYDMLWYANEKQEDKEGMIVSGTFSKNPADRTFTIVIEGSIYKVSVEKIGKA